MNARDVLKDLSWLASARFAAMITTVLTTAVLARLISPTDFGIMAAVLVIVTLSEAIFEGAFGLELTRKDSVSAGYVAATVWLAVATGSLMCLCIWFCSDLIEEYYGIRGVSKVVSVSSLIFVLKAMESVAFAMLRRNKEFKKIAAYQFFCQLVVFAPVSVSLALLDWGVWALAYGQLALSASTALTSMLLSPVRAVDLVKIWSFRSHLASVIRETFWGQSSFFVISQLFNWLALNGPNAIIGSRLGATELGLYSRSWRLLDIVTKVTASPIQNVLFTSFSRMEQATTGAKVALERSLAVGVLFFAIVSAFLFVNASLLVHLLLGEQWVGSIPVVEILFLALVPRSCYKITEAVTLAMGRSRSAALRQGFYAAVMILGCVLAIPYGIAVVAIASSVSVSLFYVASLTLAAKTVSLNLKHITIVHLRGVAFFTYIYAIHTLSLASSRLVFGQISADLVACLCSIVACLLALFLLPAKWVGEDVRKFASALRRR